MGDSKLAIALKFAEKLSRKKNESKNDFQELISVLLEAVQEIEVRLDGHLNNSHRSKLKLCLLQIRYTVNRMSGILSGSEYTKKTAILKLLNKKIYLCLKEALNSFSDATSDSKILESSYHALMSEVLSILSLPDLPSNLSNLIDKLLCNCLTIAKLSVMTDFKEINACCKNIINAYSCTKDHTMITENESDYNISHLMYQLKYLERKVNAAMLRLFLHIMSYPQGALKKLVKRSGASSRPQKFSEDLDDEISEFDLTCDRIALIGNFAIKSCEQESLKLKVQNCLANLEFCEESLVPACVDFYLEPTPDKREFLKYLTNEWKTEVLLLDSLLDSIVDPAAFSLVVFEDLLDLTQKVKEPENKESKDLIFQELYQRCFKLTESIGRSPDCLSDSYLIHLKKSLSSALKENESKMSKIDNSKRIQHLEVISSLVDQLSEHLNKVLCESNASKMDTITHTTLKDVTFNDSDAELSQKLARNLTLVSKEWDERRLTRDYNSGLLVPSSYLEKAQMFSPFAFTLYQKTPVRKKIQDNVALALDISRNLNRSFDA